MRVSIRNLLTRVADRYNHDAVNLHFVDNDFVPFGQAFDALKLATSSAIGHWKRGSQFNGPLDIPCGLFCGWRIARQKPC
jgi:hypothetical protein